MIVTRISKSHFRIIPGLLVILGIVLAQTIFPVIMASPARAEVTSEMGKLTAERIGDSVNLSWTEPVGDAEMMIVDGETVVAQSGDAGQIVVEGSSNQNLQVTWFRNLTESEQIALLSKQDSSVLTSANVDSLVHFETKSIEFGSVVYQPGTTVANAATGPSSTTFRFTTFIRDQYVPAPDFACTNLSGAVYEFNGNNRGFNPIATSYKTRVSVTVDWTNSGNVSSQKAVQPTSLYLLHADGTRSFVSTGTASTSGINVNVLSESTTLSAFHINHQVANPLCSAALTGGIYYDVKTYVARSGAVTMIGESLDFPDHEYYVKDSDQSHWTTVYTSRATNIACLTRYSEHNILCKSSFNERVVR